MAYVNMVTDVGLGIITARLVGNTQTVPKYLGYGIGTDETLATMTELVSASAEDRTEGSQTQADTGGTTADTYSCVGAITCATVGKAITEVGLFDASTAGKMFNRGNFAAINLNVGDTINFANLTTFNQS